MYESPANEFVANFICTSNIVSSNALKSAVDTNAIENLKPVLNGDTQFAIRPDDFIIAQGPFEADINSLFYLCEQVQLIVSTPDGTELTVHCNRRAGNDLTVGDQITLDVDTSRIHFVEGQGEN